MGQAKLLMPWGNHTVIEAVVLALRHGGAEPVLAVVAPDGEAVAERATAAGAIIYRLPVPTPDMRSSVELGLHFLRRRGLLQPHDAWLLAPADHPTVSPSVVRTLRQVWGSLRQTVWAHTATTCHPGFGPILTPVHEGRRGHPLLLAANCLSPLLTLPAACGINALLRHPSARVVEVPCDDPTILDDLDTPADYERLMCR